MPPHHKNCYLYVKAPGTVANPSHDFLTFEDLERTLRGAGCNYVDINIKRGCNGDEDVLARVKCVCAEESNRKIESQHHSNSFLYVKTQGSIANGHDFASFEELIWTLRCAGCNHYEANENRGCNGDNDVLARVKCMCVRGESQTCTKIDLVAREPINWDAVRVQQRQQLPTGANNGVSKRNGVSTEVPKEKDRTPETARNVVLSLAEEAVFTAASHVANHHIYKDGKVNHSGSSKASEYTSGKVGMASARTLHSDSGTTLGFVANQGFSHFIEFVCRYNRLTVRQESVCFCWDGICKSGDKGDSWDRGTWGRFCRGKGPMRLSPS